jgi:enamine deaminase RidA (YjgF/YER057c/UK114 family)
VGPGDVAAQTRQAYENIRQVLAAAGCTMRDVVRFQTFLTRDVDIEGFMRARREVFPGYYRDGVYPPNTILVVSRLVQPELLIEIEAMAVKPTRGAVGARADGSPRIRVAASTKPVRAVKGRRKVRPAARRG